LLSFFLFTAIRRSSTQLKISLNPNLLSIQALYHFRNSNQPWVHPPARLILLVTMTTAYGMELCYKLSTKQLIFILNPCHMLCLIQLVLLCLDPRSKCASALFKTSLSLMHLPIIACVCPVTNTLFLPGEVFTYWLEHVLLLTVPIYLMFEGCFKPEPLLDISHTLTAYGLFGLYNFTFLQVLAVASKANLNHILCPAITDPFTGPNYRYHAMWHQLAQGWFAGKLYGLVGKAVQSTFKNEKSD
jgi:hypothetical protein